MDIYLDTVLSLQNLLGHDEATHLAYAILEDDVSAVSSILEDADHSDLLNGDHGAQILALLAKEGSPRILNIFNSYGFSDGSHLYANRLEAKAKQNPTLRYLVLSHCTLERIDELSRHGWLQLDQNPNAHLKIVGGHNPHKDVFSFFLERANHRDIASAAHFLDVVVHAENLKNRNLIEERRNTLFSLVEKELAKGERGKPNGNWNDFLEFLPGFSHTTMTSYLQWGKNTYNGTFDHSFMERVAEADWQTAHSGVLLCSWEDVWAAREKWKLWFLNPNPPLSELCELWDEICQKMKQNDPECYAQIPDEYKTKLPKYIRESPQKAKQAREWIVMWTSLWDSAKTPKLHKKM